MIKTLFFGHLPLGWKRLFRVITFVWCTMWSVGLIKRYDDDYIAMFLIGLSVSMLLSFIISGFILQKKD